VLFRNAYTYPTCSASRAAFLTGRYGRRNGMGGIVDLDDSDWELPLKEVTVPEALARGGEPWHAAAIGKWHLAGFRTPSAFRHPGLQGFERVRGALGNLPNTDDPARRGDYFQYLKNVDGAPVWTTSYATVDTTDDAIAAMRDLPEPRFVWVAYNAVHVPLHWPPSALAPGGHEPGPVPMHDAMVRSLDAEVGRLLDALTPEQRATTTIVFVGDNGTDQKVVEPPFDPKHGKATLYEGGTGVPLIVAGAGVTGRGESRALVHAVDLLPTVLELAGVSAEGLPLDGVSFASALRDPASPGQRNFVYTERFAPIGAGPYTADFVAIRDQRYKLLRTRQGDLVLFDLQGRNDDGSPLERLTPDQERERGLLEGELRRIADTVKYEY
jgi:arylsulfatase A-like enzyme